MHHDMCFDLTNEKIANMQSTQECDAALEGLGRRHASRREAIATLLPGHPCPMQPDVERQVLLLQDRRSVLAAKCGASTGGGGNTGNASGAGSERELELVPIGREDPAPAASLRPALNPNDLHRLRKQRLRRRHLGHADIDDDEGDDGGGSSGAPPPVPRPRG